VLDSVVALEQIRVIRASVRAPMANAIKERWFEGSPDSTAVNRTSWAGGSVVYFADRRDAGRSLSERLRHLKGEDVVVLGLARGGVPVAFEVAAALGAPLDVAIVRELGAPSQPELAVGAIGEGRRLRPQ
jgi:hypothetical protein